MQRWPRSGRLFHMSLVKSSALRVAESRYQGNPHLAEGAWFPDAVIPVSRYR